MSDVEPAPTKIKFCGLTDPGDAELAVEAGAWAIGMVLWPGSPRRCSLDVAAEIAAVAPAPGRAGGGVRQSDAWTRWPERPTPPASRCSSCTATRARPSAPRRPGGPACRVIKAARVRSGADIQALGPFHTDFHLLDSYRRRRPRGHRGDLRLGRWPAPTAAACR